MVGIGRTRLWLSVLICAPTGVALAQSASTRTPIEVHVQAGALECAPGDSRFDEGIRIGLNENRLAVTSAAFGNRIIPNTFCSPSESPGQEPLRIQVRIGSDGSEIYDYPPGAPADAIRTADHWLLHVAVPNLGNRLTPPLSRRVSMRVRSDREDYCANMGRVVALLVLEALNHESGRIRHVEQVVLGPDVRRDLEYSDASRPNWQAFMMDQLALIPAEGLSLVGLMVTFLALRAFRAHRRRQSTLHC